MRSDPVQGLPLALPVELNFADLADLFRIFLTRPRVLLVKVVVRKSNRHIIGAQDIRPGMVRNIELDSEVASNKNQAAQLSIIADGPGGNGYYHAQSAHRDRKLPLRLFALPREYGKVQQ